MEDLIDGLPFQSQFDRQQAIGEFIVHRYLFGCPTSDCHDSNPECKPFIGPNRLYNQFTAGAAYAGQGEDHMHGGEHGPSTFGRQTVWSKPFLAALTAASWLLTACQLGGLQNRPASRDLPATPRPATASPAATSPISAYPPPLPDPTLPPGAYPSLPLPTPGPTASQPPAPTTIPSAIETLYAKTGCFFEGSPQTPTAQAQPSAPTLVWADDAPSGIVLRGLRAGQIETETSPAGMVHYWDYNASTGTIAYSTEGLAAQPGYSSNLRTYDLASGATSQLVEGNIYGGQWSPDGSQLALICNNSLILLGSTHPPSTVATGVLWPAIGHAGYRWAPDSTRLAYFAQAQGAVAFGLYVVTVATGQVILVETFPSDAEIQYMSHTPFWSPDSQYVLYWDDFRSDPLTIARSDGSDHWQLPWSTSAPKPVSQDHFIWTPDLRTLAAFGGENIGTGQGIWLFRLSADLKTITDVRLVIAQGRLIGWAAPGQNVVVYGYTPGSWSPQVVDIDALWQASQAGAAQPN